MPGVIALAVVTGFAGSASAASWHFVTVDGTSTTGGRTTSHVGEYSTSVLLDGRPNTFYRDVEDGSLRRTWWNGTAWQYQVVDGAGGPSGSINADVGTDARAVVFAGHVHVFYYDVTNGNLRHAWLSTNGWNFEVLDGDGAPGHLDADVGSDISVVNFASGPQVYYYDITSKNLRQAYWTGSAWSYRTLDGNSNSGGRTGDDVGQYTSVTLFGAGPQVFYYDDTATTLRRAWWDGAAWRYETVDGAGGGAGRVNESVGSDTATIVFHGMLHVWYYDIDGGNLRHAVLTPYGWIAETIDGAGGTNGRVNADVGTFVSVISAYDQVHVFYRNETDSSLRHAFLTGSSWAFETLDGSASPSTVSGIDRDVGSDTSAYLYGGRLNTLYFDHDAGALRRASFG
jgi:hypothetical protein